MEHAFFYNSVNGDRVYNAESFEYWLKKFFTTGVFAGELQVIANNNMTVKMNPGYVNVDGKVKFFSGEQVLSLETADGTLDRIDSIVIERNDIERDIMVKVVKGVANTIPVATAPVRQGGIYQLVIAHILVTHGAVIVTQADVTDTRTDRTLCGIVTGTVQEYDFSQFQSQFDGYFANYKQNMQIAGDQFRNELNRIIDTSEQSWDAWFDKIKQEFINEPAIGSRALNIEAYAWEAHGGSAGTNYGTLSMAYGNGMIIAMTDSDIMISKDGGASWKEVTLNTDKLRSIVFGNGYFVAVGEESEIMYSADGELWNVVTHQLGTRNLHFVAYIQGKFVAVGDYFTVIYASDVTSWDKYTGIWTASDWSLKAVTANDERIVLVGDDDRVFYSDFGLTNIEQATNTAEVGNQYNFKSVAYGNGKFIAVGENIIKLSDDGINWTSYPHTGYRFDSVTYAHGTFIVCRFNTATYSGEVMYSESGHDFQSLNTWEKLVKEYSFYSPSYINILDNKVWCVENGSTLLALEDYSYIGIVSDFFRILYTDYLKRTL